jgi:hypothetical protein
MIQYLKLDNLRPNNWFLDKAKLESIRNVWKKGEQYLLPAIHVTLVDNEYSLIDGHCRAFVAIEYGVRLIRAEIIEPEESGHNTDLRAIFHRQGPFIGIRKVKDLGMRIIDSQTSEKKPVHISARLGAPIKVAVR